MTEDPIMEQCVKKPRVMFWGNLSEAESNELVQLYEKRRRWYNSWDLAMVSTTKYGHKPLAGPTAWMLDKDLHRMNDLQRKGWGMIAEDKK